MLVKLGVSQQEMVRLQSAAASGADGGAARHQIENLKQEYIDSFGKDAGLNGAPTADKVDAKWDSDRGTVTQYGNDQIGRHDAVNQEQLNAHKAEAGLPTRGEIEANAVARQDATDGQMSANQSKLDAGETGLDNKQAKETGEIEHNAERGAIVTAADGTVKAAKELAYGADTLATKAYNATNENVTNPALALVGMDPIEKVEEPKPLQNSMGRFNEFRPNEDFSQKKSPMSDHSGHVGGNVSRYDHLIQEAAAQHNIDPDIIRAMMKQESGGNSNATSNKGAGGLMQLMPATAAGVAEQLGMGGYDRYDPRDNIMMGAAYMKQQLNKYDGDLSLALAAYNAGPGAVDKYNGIPPYRETQNYVAKITDTYQKLKG
jgi:soluble lytic murein transglycosylase-like protein